MHLPPIPTAALALAALGFLAAASAGTRAQSGKRPKPAASDGARARDGDGDSNLPQRYFATCDYDSDSQIDFTEASASLGVDQAGFALYDDDRDGLIRLSEFRRRYAAIVSAGGVFMPPKGKPVRRAALPSSAAKVLERFDKVPDEALDARELDLALVEMGATRLEAESTLEQFDRDGTDKLERNEIEELLALLRPGSTAASRSTRAKSVDELFGKVVPREMQQGSTPQPPRLAGPVSPFRRLDVNADGRITSEDLGELQRPLSLPVRAPAVVAALDRDGDGAISVEEFRTAMGAR